MLCAPPSSLAPSLFLSSSSCCSSLLPLSLLTLTDGNVSRFGGFSSSLLSPSSSSTSISDRDLFVNDEFLATLLSKVEWLNNASISHRDSRKSLQSSFKMHKSKSRHRSKLSVLPVEFWISMFHPSRDCCWLSIAFATGGGAFTSPPQSDPATGIIIGTAGCCCSSAVDDSTGDDDDSVEFSAFFDFTKTRRLFGMLLASVSICTKYFMKIGESESVRESVCENAICANVAREGGGGFSIE